MKKALTFLCISLMMPLWLSSRVDAASIQTPLSAPAAAWTLTNNGLASSMGSVGIVAFEGALYSLSPKGAIFKSTDEGVSWQQVSLLEPDDGFEEGMGTLLVFNNELYLFGTNSQEIFSSTDGVNWSHAQTPSIPQGNDPTWAVQEIDGAIFMMTQDSGVYKTLDGKTWTSVLPNNPDAGKIFSANGVAILDTANGICASYDQTQTWSKLSLPVGSQAGGGLNYVTANGHAFYYVSTDNNAHQLNIYSSTDAHHWLLLSHISLAEDETFSGIVQNNGQLYILTAGADNGLQEKVYSSSNGSNWTTSSFMLQKNMFLFNYITLTLQHVLTLNGVLYLVTNVGVYASHDQGKTWQVASFSGSKVNASRYPSLVNYFSDGTTNFFSTGIGTYRSVDAGANWNAVGSRDTVHVTYLYADSDGSVYATTLDGGIYHLASSSAANWTKFGALPFAAGQISGMYFDDATKTLYVASYSGLWSSKDNGTTWTQEPIGQSKASSILPPVEAVAADNNTLFATTLDSSNSGTLYKRPKSGGDWSKVNINASGTVTGVQTIGSTDYAFVSALSQGSTSSVYSSTDGGNTWVAGHGLDTMAYPISLTKVGSKLFLATMSGVYVSTDNGLNWQRVPKTFGEPTPDYLPIVYAGNTLYLGYSSGFRTLLTSTDNGVTWNPDTEIGYQSVQDIVTNGKTVYLATPKGVYSQAITTK